MTRDNRRYGPDLRHSRTTAAPAWHNAAALVLFALCAVLCGFSIAIIGGVL